MTSEVFLALCSFAAITAYTPGPNNTILMASGIHHGLRQSIPMILGVALGFPMMIGVIGLGLGALFDAVPVLYVVLKMAGAAYMLWLAWKIANAGPAGAAGPDAPKPMSFLQGAAFQWVNPKGWVMAVTALSTFTIADQYYAGLTAIVLTFMVVGLTSAATWALFGVGLRHVMSDRRYYRAINVALALALVASLWPLLDL
jgi:threonine/homoserine/homoserine lactone efflux protein